MVATVAHSHCAAVRARWVFAMAALASAGLAAGLPAMQGDLWPCTAPG
jgi:hypothetical protein